MPMLAAAAPAISAIAGLAGTGASVASAIQQGQNPGTAALDPNVGKMDPSGFGYGGGIQSTEQKQFSDAFNTTKAANDAATQKLASVQAELALAQAASKKGFWQRTPEEKAALENMPKNAAQLPGLTAEAQKTGAAFKDAEAKFKGAPNLAESEANRFGGLADTARNRELTKADLTNYNESRDAFKAGAVNVDNAIALQKTAAEGNAPSVAQMQLRQGLDQANAQAAGMAAGARGGGGNLALAARQAQMQQGQNAMATNQQNAMLRASEMAQARDAYAQSSINARAQQLQAAGLDADTAMKQATLEIQDRALRTSEAMGYEGLRAGAYGAQQKGSENFQTTNATNEINVATGNRGAANTRFQDVQAGTAGAVQAGGRALEGITKAAEHYYPPKTAAGAKNPPTSQNIPGTTVPKNVDRW